MRPLLAATRTTWRNHSLNRTRYGKHRKAEPRRMVHHLSLTALPSAGR